MSIVPIDATMRRINYYTSQFQLVQSKDIDANYDDYNNNGAFANDGKTIFATLSTVVTVDKTGNVTKDFFVSKKILKLKIWICVIT